MRQFKFALVIAALAVVTFAGNASAQLVNYGVSGNSRAGLIVPVICGADSLIQDGTVVMVDTTTAATTNQKRIVVVPYNGVVLNRYRFLGIAVGNIKKPGNAATGHRGARGNVMIWGYHPSAKVASSTQSGGIPIKVGPLYGKFGTAADTTGLSVGFLIGPGTNNTASNPRAQVFLTRIGSAHGQTLN